MEQGTIADGDVGTSSGIYCQGLLSYTDVGTTGRVVVQGLIAAYSDVGTTGRIVKQSGDAYCNVAKTRSIEPESIGTESGIQAACGI